jgi:hypothetical protein
MNLPTLCALTFLAGSLATSAGAHDFVARSSTKLTLHFAGTGAHTLEVRDIHGAITVEAYDGPNIEMVVDKSISAETEDALKEAERDVILDTSDNATSIHAIVRYPDQGSCGEENGQMRSHHEWPKYDVRFDFTIRVPRATRLELCTINQGDVRVAGTHGDFDIRSVNGRITMTDVAGSGNAITVNGPVTASFVSAPGSASTFKTVNGGVILTLPDGLSADLRMKTFNGGLFTDFEVQPLSAGASLSAEKHGGMSVYRTTGFTTVRAGKGGPELTLESLNGDVRVLRRST